MTQLSKFHYLLYANRSHEQFYLSFECQHNKFNYQMFRRVGRLAKKFLWNIDLFASPQLLRYRNETNYSTLTGGCISLIIIVIFGTFLIKNSVSVLTKSEVIARDSTYFLENPTYTSFKFDSSSKFMIGVGLQDIDLNTGGRYFDIQLISLVVKYGSHLSIETQQLQPCKQEQWSHFEGGASSYKNLKLNTFLCPSSNITVELQGKFTSDSFRLLELRVSKCKNSTDPSRPCVSDTQIQKQPTYSLNYYFLNAYLNSGNLEPVGYYLEDRNYFGFTTDTTIVSNLYLTENIVGTDNSLFPWQDPQNETVLLIKQQAEVKERVQVPDQYISVYLRKSPYYILSERSFPKLEDLLSSIGGLFGFAITFFFFMQFYTEASFEIQMGDRLFFYSSQQPLKSTGFNFFFFIAYLFYQILRQLFCIDIPWQRMRVYYECREQIKQQLDISHLMNKITFLEKCMNIVFQQHQFRAIYLQQKPSVKEAEILRKNHGLNKIIHKNSKKINKKIQQKLQFHKNKLINNIKKAKKVEKNGQQKYRGSKQKKSEKEMKDLWRQEQKQRQEAGIELRQIVGNFILNGFIRDEERPPENKLDLKISKISQMQQEQKQSKSYYEVSQNIRAQQIAGQSHESLQFINTALQDIRQIEEQSKQGNVFSQRIYNKLNNDITKEQLIILKCLETILQNKPSVAQKPAEVQNNAKLKLSKKNSIFQSLMRLTSQSGTTNNKPEGEEKNYGNGLEIILQSNNRINTHDDI